MRKKQLIFSILFFPCLDFFIILGNKNGTIESKGKNNNEDFLLENLNALWSVVGWLEIVVESLKSHFIPS